jgi:hypothetical protein
MMSRSWRLVMRGLFQAGCGSLSSDEGSLRLM